MESAFPENTDKKIVCFRHIKVERLAGKKPEFEMPPKDFFFSTDTSKHRGESALLSEAKTK